MTRAQCIVPRGNRVLMVRHHWQGLQWWCLPGGGVEVGETAAQAALRELEEECGVVGKIIRQASHYTDDAGIEIITFLLEIGDQVPHMGVDPELVNCEQVIVDMQWLSLEQIPERDRAYLWAAGLMSVPPFLDELSSWGDDVSYPSLLNDV